jgi:hypothetical protein
MELIPGFLQGVTRVLISYPFDYIRTNLQSQGYTSSFSYIKQKKLSIKDAYRGCTLPLLTVPIDRSIQFSIFERLNNKNSILLSSVLSSFISSIYSVPVNFFSTYLITNHRVLNRNAFDNFIKDKKLYNGFRADITKSFIGATFYTSIYGTLRKSIDKKNHNYFLFGILSSIGSWCVIYPIDTIRVVKQTSDLSYINIIKNTPVLNLYKGFYIIVLRSVPSAGCGMFVYEKSKQLLL